MRFLKPVLSYMLVVLFDWSSSSMSIRRFYMFSTYTGNSMKPCIQILAEQILRASLIIRHLLYCSFTAMGLDLAIRRIMKRQEASLSQARVLSIVLS